MRILETTETTTMIGDRTTLKIEREDLTPEVREAETTRALLLVTLVATMVGPCDTMTETTDAEMATVVVTDTTTEATMKRDRESSEMAFATTARRRATRLWTAQKVAEEEEAVATTEADTEEAAAEWTCDVRGALLPDRWMTET